MIEIGLRFALELRDYALGQYLAELNSPLVERVDIPNDGLRKNGMFVKGHELTQSFWGELVGGIVFDGLLPSNTRCGTSQSGVPSAFTCSGVLPNARASVCAKTFASSMS